MIFKQWSPLQPPYGKEHSSSYLQHPQRRMMHPVLHTKWIASGRQHGAGRRLIAITIILPFLMCHRNVHLGNAVCATVGSCVVAQTGVERYQRWEASCTNAVYTTWGHFMVETCRWSVPNGSLSAIESNGRLLLDFAISFWLDPSDKRIYAYLRKNWQDFSFMIGAKLFI